jgi:hypothetical protein
MEENIKRVLFEFEALSYPTPDTMIDAFKKAADWCEENSSKGIIILSINLDYDQEYMDGYIEIYYKYRQRVN